MTSRWRTAAAVARLAPWFVAFGVMKRFVSLSRLARFAYQSSRQDAERDIRRIASRVLRTGSLTGMPDRDCLQRSLVLYRELSVAGLSPELAIGFQQTERGLAGHAWVTVAGRVVAEPDVSESVFVQVVRFGERGAPVLIGSERQ